jgi:hypothetical protein
VTIERREEWMEPFEPAHRSALPAPGSGGRAAPGAVLLGHSDHCPGRHLPHR